MKRILKILIQGLITAVFFLNIVSNFCIASNRILAVVGEDIITSNSLEARYAALIKTNNLSPTADEVKIIRFQLLHSLINEKIIMQEALRLQIDITDEDIKETIEDTERSQNLPKGSFIKHHEQYGITKDDIWEQMRVKLAWQKILVNVVLPTYGKASISDAELNEFIIQNRPGDIKIKGFVYSFDKTNLKVLGKLNKTNRNNLCDVEFLKQLTGSMPKKVNSVLQNIRNPKIRQIASFAKDMPAIVTAEQNDKTVALVVCEKKPTISTEELDKMRVKLKNKKMELYTEYYLKNLKKKMAIKINDVQQLVN